VLEPKSRGTIFLILPWRCSSTARAHSRSTLSTAVVAGVSRVKRPIEPSTPSAPHEQRAPARDLRSLAPSVISICSCRAAAYSGHCARYRRTPSCRGRGGISSGTRVTQ
jgi:hypothetical protein